MAQAVKNLPAMQETQVRSLGQEGPLEKGMATHSSILAWRIPWREEPGGLQSRGSQSQTRLSDSLTLTHTHTHTQRQRKHKRMRVVPVLEWWVLKFRMGVEKMKQERF